MTLSNVTVISSSDLTNNKISHRLCRVSPPRFFLCHIMHIRRLIFFFFKSHIEQLSLIAFRDISNGCICVYVCERVCVCVCVCACAYARVYVFFVFSFYRWNIGISGESADLEIVSQRTVRWRCSRIAERESLTGQQQF